MNKKINDICAIIVTYNPNINPVLNLATELAGQMCDVIVVDNSPVMSKILNSQLFNYIWLGGNRGIATAQNVGINFCIESGYKTIIFFDQDSNINEQFIATLFKPMQENDFKICAPTFYDEKKGFEYAITNVRKSGARVKIFSEGKTEPFTSSIVISSGTIVRTDVFEQVGLMDDGLFIDYVDTEWCLRCFSENILVHIIPQAKMIHSIGDKSFNIFGFCVPVHSPARRYYRVRNAFHLFRYKHVPKLLAIREISFCFIHSFILIFKQKNKKEYLYSFLAGIRDGVLNVRGEKPNS
ncbi:rhamnosyltransferase [Enterobacteriaceae bacterium Kacie_13]|nr:rhamnosyltransferase [Enterobacteriaceae bacterium Kacie_13]